ncbi:hypothetical protein PHYSODRAFT_284663 [Phytophthora sojae]|uniref:RxLR effector protein n=2 Tax=Phytophthora sojae TaxID=67593 RepID=G4YRD1_PHYSP|nr:hypothetical protein PHYSODRAFT_284663 [Phytophthora sojae]AEK80912.1 Avh205 [Phytophthora sojae]AEK80913.1 Avh205 [Phytophthora sojae]AEK80914.1 Avh205 [Phytophthora sojae]EGZ22865.1 hypothetical protein PHYSODRAFT_284663 [Phytophthora sojae]|eukprot:XP_009518153.1 hypothetical protein PHYSODRAFT_284663 [Phytophthora sojae]
MQFGFFLLVAAAVHLVCSDVVSASIDKEAALSKSFVDSADAVSVSGSFLRTSELPDTDSDDQANESDDEERGVSGVLTEKAAGTAAKLTRSKSLESEKAVVQKLTRSKSLSDLKAAGGLDDVRGVMKTSLNKDYLRIDNMKKTPDDIVSFFGLDTKLLAKADRQQLRAAANGDKDKLGQLELWYRYSKYYKQKYPGWASKLVV